MGVFVRDALKISSLEPASTHWDHIYGVESQAHKHCCDPKPNPSDS